MKPVRVPPLVKKQHQKIKESAFLLGVQCGAKVSVELVKSGRTDMQKLEAEVVRRVRGR